MCLSAKSDCARERVTGDRSAGLCGRLTQMYSRLATGATRDEDCKVGAGGVVRAAAICRAIAVREVESRAPLELKSW